MTEYIKQKDALDMHFSVGLQDGSTQYVRYTEVKDNIKHIPTADVVEVRHGHWVLRQPNSLHLDWRDSLFECSVCRMNRIRRTGEILNYCPNCGARMDGKEQEHD